jgi:hypothetical protein
MSVPPVIRNEGFRVRMTTSCRDADAIPKVHNAGQVVDAGGGRFRLCITECRSLAVGKHNAQFNGPTTSDSNRRASGTD